MGVGGTVSVTLQFIAGPRQVTELPSICTVEAIVHCAEQAFGTLTAGGVKVVLRGAALPVNKPNHVVTLRDGDHLLVAPQRKAPSPEIVAAVTRGSASSRVRHDDGDDEEDRIALPQGTPRWEVAVVEALRNRARCPDWILEWVVLLRPWRLALFCGFLLGCVISSRLGLGPLFVLGCLIGGIFTNLGTRRAGELSAYSIFNRGVRRLPGQLDAEEIDRQMRQGQLG
ncbi:hypothetical protein VOLCADRAFT_81244 [Volvox carteri f. nagariensis]|uniref:SAYSvFN domain-containing protein n=1 Tax=Volvox carteri f. nagariensis TaxID=3068 RepID=D8TWM8_VOLCA|nr:uncharacterized protein VOLCADRAFT_81244 [Volvox carteri f. nagariensis]EFJ48079.1 hypothetical protein VOLCADRAFT_81244 [Volvox carteri f. nagariensis]|eukprot:XP_002950764.1 hypothetical protein VOLCADRAFT_81244 [Volvox carteri f. nagariensis]